VVDTFLDRIREMLVGQNLMNCALCKYREQALGFEADVGLRQESHHHHVEGLGSAGYGNCPCSGDCDGSCQDEAFARAHNLPLPKQEHDHAPPHPHRHDRPHAPLSGSLLPPIPLLRAMNGHTHDAHGHHHHPYPHADHPLGPLTLPKIQGRLAQ
jgi:sirohydrochlorin cobaltochelatase